MQVPTREDAYALLTEFNRKDRLIKHGLAVEAVMRHMAAKLGHDEEKWGIVGLIHDLDYEQYPEQHCAKTEEILRQRDRARRRCARTTRWRRTSRSPRYDPDGFTTPNGCGALTLALQDSVATICPCGSATGFSSAATERCSRLEPRIAPQGSPSTSDTDRPSRWCDMAWTVTHGRGPIQATLPPT